MADDSSAQKVDPRLVAEIVRSYVAKTSIGVDQIGGLIATVHRTLSGLGASAPMPAPGPLEPAVPIRRSVQHDHVVCPTAGFAAKPCAGISAPRRARAGGVSRPLEIVARSRVGRTGLFGAASDDGEGD